MGWSVETLNETVDAEVEALPEDMRARLARIAKLIEEQGLERLGEPHVKHVEGGLWEMRLKRAQRHFAGAVCDRRGPARGDRAGLREENGENATARDRAGLVPREIGSMMEVWKWRA
jgi:hypothetical protein